MKDKTTILIASAGTGKTTRLLRELETVLETTPPNKVAFTTFTVAGAEEARDRACLKFGLSPTQLPWFRTLNSLCYRNIRPRNMITWTENRQFARSLGLSLSGKVVGADDSDLDMKLPSGDRIFILENLRRTNTLTHKEAVNRWPLFDIDERTLIHWSTSYKEHKESIGKIDFIDQFELFLTEGWELPIETLFVDEAQDLSPLQWKVVKRLAEPCSRVVVAGDDKQAIYEFSGASPSHLIELEGKEEYLDTTYRLPQEVLNYSEKIAGNIRNKRNYRVKTNKPGGKVIRTNTLDICDLEKGTWFLLVRNRQFASIFERQLIERGLPFKGIMENMGSDTLITAIKAWDGLLRGVEATGKEVKAIYEYLPTRDRVKHGSKTKVQMMDDTDTFTLDDLTRDYGLLTDLPWDLAFRLSEEHRAYYKKLWDAGQLGEDVRIEVNTIHQVKGREADNVVILPDISYRTAENLRTNPDSEHRVFYVAATRAKENLYLMEPWTRLFYRL